MDIVGEKPSLSVPHCRLDGLCFSGNFCLATKGLELTANLVDEVLQTGEVCLHRVEFAHRLFFATAVLENSGGLFDKATAIIGCGVENPIELSLADDDVHFSAQPGVTQELLNIEEAARLAVDRVFAGPVSKQGSGNSDFAVVNR